MTNEDLIQFTQKSIQTASFTGQEQAYIQLVLEEMKRLGFDQVWVDPAGNVVGEISGDRPGKSILLDAHADTVTVNAQDWSVDPFSGCIRDGRMVGRGTADTKGNLTAMLYGAARIDRKKICGKVFVSATVHEEVFEGGSLKIVMGQVKPDYVVIGEATNLNVNRGGRGRAEIIVESIGVSAHSSSPEVGKCAVHEMMRLIEAIESEKRISHPFLGPSTMVLTDIISNPYPGHSVVPNTCKVTFDRRLLLGETSESLEKELMEFAKQANVDCTITLLDGKETTYTGYEFLGKKFFPAWLYPEDNELVLKSYQAVRTLAPASQLGAYRFCTNAAYSAGIAGIPTVGFGLGKETDAHTADESIAISDLLLASEGYKVIIEEVLS
jgi:putative selenium metabolism hydrolase